MKIKILTEFGEVLQEPVDIHLGSMQTIVEIGTKKDFAISQFISLSQLTCLNSFQLNLFRKELEYFCKNSDLAVKFCNFFSSIIDRVITEEAFLVFDPSA